MMTCDHLERRIFYEWAVVSTGVSGLTTWVPPRPFLALVRSYLSDSSLVVAWLILRSICLILLPFVDCAARRKVDPGALLAAQCAPGVMGGWSCRQKANITTLCVRSMPYRCQQCLIISIFPTFFCINIDFC